MTPVDDAGDDTRAGHGYTPAVTAESTKVDAPSAPSRGGSGQARSVLFISNGVDTPSTRYRALQYMPMLEARGWRASHLTAGRSLRESAGVLRAASQADVVVVIRRTFVWGFRRLLRLASRRLLFDYDDAIHLYHDARPGGTRLRRFASMVSMADHIVAGNEYLAQAARNNGARGPVTVAPTAIDLAGYERAVARKPADSLDLVWIGSSSTRPYLELAMPWLEEAATRVPNLRLNIVADFDLPSTRFKTVPLRWAADREASWLASSHIGIAPMPDDPWTRGKCGCKVLQYMAAGLPVISSPAGVNRDFVEPGKTGLLPESPAAWIETIATLAGDAALRERMGRAGLARVREHFSTERMFERLLKAIEGN